MPNYPFAEDAPPSTGAGDQGILDQIATYLSDPKIGGAVLNAGLDLMGGGQWGDTGTSRLARAVGAGGASVRSQEDQMRKEAEARSKEELRAAQASAAEARAGGAGARSETEAAKLELARQRLDQMQQQIALRERLGDQSYELKLTKEYVNDVQKNSLLTAGYQVPTIEEWSKSKGIVAPRGTTNSGAGATAGGEGALPLPKTKEELVTGKTYQTREGPRTWNGTTF